LTMKEKLGGVFGLSCYLVLGNKIKDFVAEGGNKNKDTPFFMGHGDADETVKYQWGFKTAQLLKEELGIKNVDFRTYKYVDNFAPLSRTMLLISDTGIYHTRRLWRRLMILRSGCGSVWAIRLSTSYEDLENRPTSKGV
jgi:hypothetical protein